MSYVLACVAALLGISIILVFVGYWKRKARLQRERAAAISSFYAAMDPLIKDTDTPEEILEVLKRLNSTIGSRQAVFAVLSHRARQQWWTTSEGISEFNKVAVEFFNRRPELEKPFVAAVREWFIAVTALSPIWGIALRASMSREAVPSAADVAAASLKRNDASGHMGPDGTVHA